VDNNQLEAVALPLVYLGACIALFC